MYMLLMCISTAYFDTIKTTKALGGLCMRAHVHL